ncbi:MAG: flagellar biosynthetic protein FliR [Polyangiaceae bacterium]
MILERLIVESAGLFALSASRIAGFVLISPFPGQNVSRTQRATLVVVLAWVTMSFAPNASVPKELGLQLVGQAALEIACGLVVGIAFHFVFAAAEVLGAVLGQMTGLSSPSVLNPTMDAPETAIARIVGLCAMLLALSAGVHRVALGALLESFRALPVGSAAILGAPVLRFVDLGADAFVVGVRLATPIVGVALLVQLALAMVSRAAPSVQIFSVGFGVLFASGMLSLLTCFDDIAAGLNAHFATLAPFIDEAIGAMRK